MTGYPVSGIGWQCGMCRALVPYGTLHHCTIGAAGARARTPEERIASALERIAAALEGRA